MIFGRGSRFRYFPVGVVSEDVVIVRGGGRYESEIKISD